MVSIIPNWIDHCPWRNGRIIFRQKYERILGMRSRYMYKFVRENGNVHTSPSENYAFSNAAIVVAHKRINIFKVADIAEASAFFRSPAFPWAVRLSRPEKRTKISVARITEEKRFRRSHSIISGHSRVHAYVTEWWMTRSETHPPPSRAPQTGSLTPSVAVPLRDSPATRDAAWIITPTAH